MWSLFGSYSVCFAVLSVMIVLCVSGCASVDAVCSVLLCVACSVCSLCVCQCAFVSVTVTLKWAKSPIASAQRTRSILAGHSAVPGGTNVTRMNANRAIQMASATNVGSMGADFCVLGGGIYDNQRTPVIRIAAKMFVSDSAITIARVRLKSINVICMCCCLSVCLLCHFPVFCLCCFICLSTLSDLCVLFVL